MSDFRIYFSYPNSSDGYSDFEEVTDDVLSSSIGSISEQLEANEYDVGAITFGNIKLVFRNETAKYSEASNASSIFPYKRDKTIVKITWNRNTYPAACGNTPCGNTFLVDDVTVFKGLLEDNSTSFDVKSQTIEFQFLSMDSIISKVDTPYSSLSVSDDAETLLYTILNQTDITRFFTVSASNISVSNNFTPDSIANLEDTTCLESVQEILKMANAIMFVRNDILYIRSREADASSSFTFYGPSSDNGIENIHNISKYNVGLNRCFNYWKWEDTTLTQVFTDSITKYGLRKKDLSSALITNNTKRTNVLNSYVTEFGFPATELTLTAPMTTEIVGLGFLNRVNIDYPSEVVPTLDEQVSRYGQSVYGTNRYAKTINSLFIASTRNWKILNRKINTRTQQIEFKLREIL